MKPIRKLLSIILLVLIFVGPLLTPGIASADDSSAVFLAKGALWKYQDGGVDLGTNWRAVDYNDSTWQSGNAPLGFGDDYSETDPTLPLATPVGYGSDANNKHMTTYFRTSFVAANLSNYTALEVYIHVDDGAVVYINGAEAFRRGIADGAVDYNTSAKFSLKEETFQLPVSALHEGSNTIAAEVHQDDGQSSDLWFEMSIAGLTGTEPVVEEPTVTVDPNAEVGTVSKVTVSFYDDTKSTRGFTWYTTRRSINSDLQVVAKTGALPDFNQAMSFTGTCAIPTNTITTPEYLHKAEATGLNANSEYFYRVGEASLDLWSDAGTFKTAPAGGAFTFIDLADTQAKTEEEAILSSQTISKALTTVDNAEFFAINGDIVDTGSNENQWDWVLGHSQSSLLNTTILPVAGNHDEQTNSFIDHFDIQPAAGSSTATGAYYSCNYSNAHFIVLNNNEDSTEYADFTPAQIQWLQSDVQAARNAGYKWVIAIMHKGPYSTSNHATDADIMGANGVRTLVAPIMEQLGIDLVLQGHDHIYARSKPIKSNGKADAAERITETVNGQNIEYTVNPDGTIYLIPSTAGPKVYYKNTKINDPGNASYVPGYYDLFDVADEHHAAIYGPDPSDASRPTRSMVQNFEAITVDGDKLTVVSYEIDQGDKIDGDANNANPYIIDQFGIVKDDSAAAYQSRIPSQISLAMTPDPQTSIGINWTTIDTTLTDARVMVWKQNADESTAIEYNASTEKRTVSNSTLKDSNDQTITEKNFYSATVAGLQANTEYKYRCGAGNNMSGVRSFTTAQTNNDEYKFIYVSDSQVKDSHSKAWNANLDIAKDMYPDAKFVYIAGDLTDTAANEGQWESFYNQPGNAQFNDIYEGSFISELPLAAAMGNHDGSNNGAGGMCSHYTWASEVNGVPVSYAFDYGAARFIVINSENAYNVSDATIQAAQQEFVTNEVTQAKSAGQWAIVCFHKAIYSGADHMDDSDIIAGRKFWSPVFAGLDVDVVLQGHDHVLSRGFIEADGTKADITSKVADRTYRAAEPQNAPLYYEGNCGSSLKFYAPLANNDWITEGDPVAADYGFLDLNSAEPAGHALNPLGPCTNDELEGIDPSYVRTPTFTAVTVAENSIKFETYMTGFDSSNNAVNRDTFLYDSFTLNKSDSIPKYSLAPVANAAYDIGATSDGIKTMTVKSGTTGFKYFEDSITPVVAHNGTETVVFVHIRSGMQLAINATKADFDTVGSAKAGFNVQPGDIIKSYIVDDLTNETDRNPILFQ